MTFGVYMGTVMMFGWFIAFIIVCIRDEQKKKSRRQRRRAKREIS